MAKNVSVKTVEALDVPLLIKPWPFYDMTLDDEQLVFANAVWSPDIDIVFCNAKAGSGKTTVATGVAKMLVDYKRFSKIIYIMSPCGDRKQGWLPGTITEKSSVYFEGFYQACVNCGINPTTDFNTNSMVNQKEGTGYITCITDTYIRGSNFENAVVIIDEAQNYTVQQLKTTLTRVKDNTKIIVIGHDQQCDLERPGQSGFLVYMDHFKGKPKAATCQLTTNHRGWVSQWADELSVDSF